MVAQALWYIKYYDDLITMPLSKLGTSQPTGRVIKLFLNKVQPSVDPVWLRYPNRIAACHRAAPLSQTKATSWT